MKKVYYADRYAFNPIGAEGFLLIENGTHLTYFDLDVIEELDIDGGKTNG